MECPKYVLLTDVKFIKYRTDISFFKEETVLKSASRVL